MRLQDRVAVVTGSGGPMGAAIAARFAAEGAKVVLNDISGRRLAGTEAMLKEAGHDVAALRADVCNRPEAEALIGLALESHGRVDVLVNVVGGLKGAIDLPVMEIDDERWDFTMRINLKGALACTQLVVPSMRQAGAGSIVNISSISYAGVASQADYAAGKAGVAAFTRSCALEFAPEIRVNAIMPGPIATSVVERQDPERLEAWIEETPLRKIGRPEDIANSALFLASDEAGHITGQFLYVSGGLWPSL
ncbi:MAG: SDR family NAD(P)-dependent oxidoreductase [Alphaproteobacteria bacterium]|jgi:NAD(P)-dependent dehydrogenase (short-subunit alcohol dehydrogenase family)|nr:SDR family NAD(P)-dependent oxidoreductase [Alphaproteobacteria bacterium]